MIWFVCAVLENKSREVRVMPLVNMNDILIPARKGGYATGAFEFWSLDSAQAVVWAAETLKMPVILQAGPFECEYAGGPDKLAAIARLAAGQSTVPVALHLDHGDTIELVRQCISAGFTSVMIDVSHSEYAVNVEITCRVVQMAKEAGVSVESELGTLPGAEARLDIRDEEALQTDPDEAMRFVKETGIDALAVAIGTVHGFYKFTPRINIPRLKAIAEKVSIPLVLHGGSGTPEGKVLESIRHGIAKINICTEFLQAMGKGYTSVQAADGFKYSVPALFAPARQAGMELVMSKIKLFSCR
jgi:fructose-bisphosphate aldolase, class II